MKNINNIKRGPLANCIALHDFAMIPENIKEWFDYTLDFFRAHGIEPTRMSSQKTDKTVSMKIGIKQLEENDYKINENIWIGATPPNHNSDMFDSIFMVSLEYTFGTTFVLCFDNQITHFDNHLIDNLTKYFSIFSRSQYGYAYQHKFSQGPDFYAVGSLGGRDRLPDEEREKINRWNNVYCMPDGIYTLGDLRDIYPYNFLSTPHLERDIFGQPLRQWIESHSSRGKLTPLTDTLWSWHLTPDQISPVRNALAPTGIILCP